MSKEFTSELAKAISGLDQLRTSLKLWLWDKATNDSESVTRMLQYYVDRSCFKLDRAADESFFEDWRIIDEENWDANVWRFALVAVTAAMLDTIAEAEESQHEEKDYE